MFRTRRTRMFRVVKFGVILGLGLCAAGAAAQEGVWRPVRGAAEGAKSAPVITLGRPVPLDAPPLVPAAYVAPPVSAPALSLGAPRPIVRAQGADLPPP